MPKVSAAPAPAPTTPTVATAAAPMTSVAIPPGAPPPRIAMSNPDQMVNVGLANNFNGRVLSMSLLPRKQSKGKKKDTYTLAVEITIQADDTSIGKDGLVIEYLNVCGLNQWVPSRTDPQWNGAQWIYTPAGGTLDQYLALHQGTTGWPDPTGKMKPDGSGPELAVLPPDDWRGFFAIPGAQNSQDEFPKGGKWEQFNVELNKAGYRTKAPHINTGDFRQFLVGVYGHWVRLPFEFKGSAAPDDAQKTDTLCLAEILDLGPISGKTNPTPGTATVTVQAAPAAMMSAAPASAVPAQVPAAVAAAVAAPASPVPPSPLGRNDPAAISQATNEIITGMALAKPTGVTKQEAGVSVFEGVNARNLDGATALRFLNDNDWMEDDERTFGYDASKGLILPLG